MTKLTDRLPSLADLEPPGGTQAERARIEQIWRETTPSSSKVPRQLAASGAEWAFYTALLRAR